MSEPASFVDLLRQRAVDRSEAPALVSLEGEIQSYGQLVAWVDRIGQDLRALGISAEDRVAAVCPPGPLAASSFIAVGASAGFAPLNPSYRTPEFIYALEDLQPKALLLPHGCYAEARTAAASIDLQVIDMCSEEGIAWALGLDGRPTSEEGAPDRESASPEPAATALLLHTSGTTAKPKLVTLTHANLLFSARQISETLKLQEDDCCLNIMPLFHIHGLIAALLSTLCSGGRIICTEGLRPADFPSWLQNFNPTWYTAVPTMHQAILKVLAGSRPRPACPGLRFVRSSSATLPARLRQDLEATLGVPVIEAYGMTEAGILIASTPLPPDASRVSSVGRTAGPEIAIIDAKGDFLPVGATGEVVIRGANVTPGYLHNPEANEKSFVNGWFRTGDQGYLDADGYLYLRGRLKEVVNRGAEKINPFEVDKQLLEHPAVAQAVAFAVPHPTLGEDLAAAVSLRPGETTDERNLREYLFERLAAHKVPSRIVIVESIPKGPTGKIQRIGLAESLADALTVRYGAPSSTWEWFLAEAFETVLKHSGVGQRDNFFHLGGDSLQAQQIINQINHSFGLELKAGVLFRYPSVADLAEVVDREAPAEKVEEEVATILEEIENLTEKEVERKLSESLE